MIFLEYANLKNSLLNAAVIKCVSKTVNTLTEYDISSHLQNTMSGLGCKVRLKVTFGSEVSEQSKD